ncbi:Ent-kaurene synthase [Gigaspora margarita]|uniref:Ent-kaurene synthase n=1 Tax=Gigaspora margarita TaxID=4874 RepID=A0A8H4A4X9_GIGMA|nr:Ent-kaurene synthase [Gigaspora margarita]
MSPCDTAWVAMIPNKFYKESKASKDFSLAFPQCFMWLFNNQDANGSWAGNDASSITPGLAGLLALGLFRSHSGDYFETKLNDLGITISSSLQESQRKLSLIPLDVIITLAKSQPITLTHSIEAFCEKIDLSRIQNKGFQAINGCYGSSPAATASVLLHAKKWDDKAFEFLKMLISRCPTYAKSHGLVSTISDVGIFETIWVMHSIGDLCFDILANKNIKLKDKSIKKLFSKNFALIKYLSTLNKNHGTVCNWLIKRFNPVGTVDLDVIAKTFYNGKYFNTYPNERTFSISCNVHVVNLFVSEYRYSKSKKQMVTISDANKNDIIQMIELEEIILNVVKFLISQRGKDEPGNLEETSYIIRLLKTAAKYLSEDTAIQTALHDGKTYLIKHLDESMMVQGYFNTKQPFLWIGKQLYTVPRIIKSSILASLWEN